MKSIGLTFLKLSAAVLAVLAVSESSASAQSLTVSFTLPHEVTWGKSVLPAGDYTITVDSPRRPALVRSQAGQGHALVLPTTVNPAIGDQPSALILGQGEKGQEVRYLNLREANVSLGYGLGKPGRKVARRSEPEPSYAALTAK